MAPERSATRAGPRRPARAEHPRLHPFAENGAASVRRLEERDALMEVAGAAAAAASLEDVLESTAEACLAAMGAGSVSISRWEREEGVVRTLINVGELGPGEERWPENEVYDLVEYPNVARLLRTGEPYYNAVDDPEADPIAVALLRRLGKESDIGVPIPVDGAVWGEVWASTCPGAARFRSADVRFVEAMAGQLAGVIARGEQFSRVSQLAYEDELTGLANRRALDERLAKATESWRQGGTPLTLLVCDVDELKAINDERGHHAGDRALRRVARALVKATAPYPGACVARMSGDEFAVVLGGVGVEAASDVAATALRILAEERDTKVAVSCGAAAAGAGLERADQLVRAADAAQYAAKRRGGGQLCTAGPDALAEELGHHDGSRRRGRRRGGAERVEEATGQALALLDTKLAHRNTVDRLEAVSAAVAELVNAAGWTISFAARGAGIVRSMCAANDRDSRLRGIRVGLDHEVYELTDFPMTARLVAAGGGSFVVDRYDSNADQAERGLLDELCFTAVLAAAVSDFDGTYLVELYADGDSRELPAVELSLSLLVRAAAASSAAAVQGLRLLRRRTDHLALCGRLAARLATARTEREVVDAAADEIHAALDYPLCGLVRLTGDGDVESAAARGQIAERLVDGGWRQSASVGLIGRALREGELVVVGDVRSEPDYRPTSETSGVRSELCAPVWAGDALWGAIDIEDDRPDAFGADEAQLLRTLADQIGAALHAARLLRTIG